MAPQELALPGTRPTERMPTVDERSLAQAARPVRVDEELLEEISELTGVSYRALNSAFAGEPKDLALDVVDAKRVADDPRLIAAWCELPIEVVLAALDLEGA